MGNEETDQASVSKEHGVFGPNFMEKRVTVSKKEKAIISATRFMYMPKNECVYKIVVNDQQQMPSIGKMKFADRTIRHQLEATVVTLPVEAEEVKTITKEQDSAQQLAQRLQSILKTEPTEQPVKEEIAEHTVSSAGPKQITFLINEDQKIELGEETQQRKRVRRRGNTS